MHTSQLLSPFCFGDTVCLWSHFILFPPRMPIQTKKRSLDCKQENFSLHSPLLSSGKKKKSAFEVSALNCEPQSQGESNRSGSFLNVAEDRYGRTSVQA